MSESQIAAAGTAGFAKPVRTYQLSDDLAKLCLPQEWKDSYRTLAWVNSVCALFLAVGLVGLKAPKVFIKPLSKVEDVVPVVFTPPEEPPKPETQVPPDEPKDQPSDAPVDTPQVVTVVAAADPSSVAFAVPVQGAVVVAPTAQAASPPPPVVKQAPKAPINFNPSTAGSEGFFPKPEYPMSAQRHGNQGTVMVEFVVDNAGNISAAKVLKTSGFSVLDDAALEIVTRKWRFAPGHAGIYHWPCVFSLAQ